MFDKSSGACKASIVVTLSRRSLIVPCPRSFEVDDAALIDPSSIFS